MTAMYRVHGRLATVFVWAMLPVALWTSSPRIGCVCANGRYKLFCERLHGGGTAVGRHSAGSFLQGCSRCDEAPPGAACCQAAAHRDYGGDESTCGGVEARCCTPVFDSPVLPPVTKALVLDDFDSCDWLALPMLQVRALASPVARIMAAESPPLIVRCELAHRVLLI